MRHRRQTHRLGRNFSKRKALLENLVASLLRYQEICTTLPKAKAAKCLADRMIHLAKKDTLHSRRLVFSRLQDHVLTSKLFQEIAPRFKKRSGGYTRILQLADKRKGDGAQMALLELTEKVIKPKKALKAKAKKGASEEKEHMHDASAESHAAEHGKTQHEKHEKEETAKPVPQKEKAKPGFFKNLKRFFRNKGGG